MKKLFSNVAESLSTGNMRNMKKFVPMDNMVQNFIFLYKAKLM